MHPTKELAPNVPTLPAVKLPDFIDLHREGRFVIDKKSPEWSMRHANESDYDKLFTQAFRLFENNRLIAVYIPRIQAEGWDTLDFRRALHNMRYDRDYRTSGLKIKSATIGFLPRVEIRRDWCTATATAFKWPEAHAEVCRWSMVAEAYYKAVAPALYAEHFDLTQTKVEPDYVLEGGVFTSGIVNHNSQLHYHFDIGNYKTVWSAMFGFKEAVTGGYLVMPEFRIAAQIRDESLFMFDGQAVFHGVTEFKEIAPDAHRYTIVYYSRRLMWNCDPPAIELARIKEIRTRREYERRFTDLDPDFDISKYPNRH